MKLLIFIFLFLLQSCIRFADEAKETEVPDQPDNKVVKKAFMTKDLIVHDGTVLSLRYDLKIFLHQSSHERYLTVCYAKNVLYKENCIFKGRFYQKEKEQIISINDPNKKVVITYITFSNPLHKEIIEMIPSNYDNDVVYLPQ